MMEDNELDDFAHLWQSKTDHFRIERESFERLTQRWHIEHRITQAIMILGALYVLVRAILSLSSGENVASALIAIVYAILIAPYLFRKIDLYYKAKWIASPLTPRDYLEVMRHNLGIEQKENRWSRRIWPWLLGFGALAVLSSLVGEGMTAFWLLRTFVVLIVLVIAHWHMFVRTPRRLRQTSRQLDELQESLLGAETDGTPG